MLFGIPKVLGPREALNIPEAPGPCEAIGPCTLLQVPQLPPTPCEYQWGPLFCPCSSVQSGVGTRGWDSHSGCVQITTDLKAGGNLSLQLILRLPLSPPLLSYRSPVFYHSVLPRIPLPLPLGHLHGFWQCGPYHRQQNAISSHCMVSSHTAVSRLTAPTSVPLDFLPISL